MSNHNHHYKIRVCINCKQKLLPGDAVFCRTCSSRTGLWKKMVMLREVDRKKWIVR